MQAKSLVLGALAVLTLAAACFGQQSDCSGIQLTSSPAEVKTRAESGDSTAQLLLAKAYESGCGVAQDFALAMKWARAAADQDKPAAENMLGLMYRTGEGVEKDPKQALVWYRKAAKHGYAPGMYNIATAYFNGDGVAISDRAAYAWMLAAQDAGQPNISERMSHIVISPSDIHLAENDLAKMYTLGQELPRNLPAALKWYTQAADGGDIYAQTVLCETYLEEY